MKISLLGITGKMGHHLAELILATPDLALVGGVTSSSNALNGQQLYGVEVGDALEPAVLQADILIDFSTAQALQDHLGQAIKHQKPIVIGTTGLEPDHYTQLKQASQHIPILYAANTSIGIAVLSNLVKIAAQNLNLDYDIEIVETHHRQKIDAPSGTALSLGKAAAAGRQVDFDHVKVMDRTDKRQAGDIGFAVMRGGGVFGEHAVRFLGDDEIIELSHTSLNRRLFAKGAIQAARWLIKQSAGLYTMQDVFNGGI